MENANPSVLLSSFHDFLEIVSLFVLKFWHGARNSHEVVDDIAWFFRKNFCPPKIEKLTKNGPKTGFFECSELFVINFYWICYIMEFYSICCVPVEIPYLEIFQMFSANQIAGFFNKPFLQNKSLKWLDFLHVDTNSYELKMNQKILV